MLTRRNNIEISQAPPAWKMRAMAHKILDAAQKIYLIPKRPTLFLSIACVGKTEMARLNARYRKRRGETDVLSFENPNETSITRGAILLGDIVLCLPVVRRQAREAGHSVSTEAAVLVAHGLMHLLGWDHERSTREAREMALYEDQLLKRAGVRSRSGLTGRAGLTRGHKVKK